MTMGTENHPDTAEPMRTPTPESLSIVVPVYNEVDNVRPLVDDIVREADKLGCPYEVILVNDGSDDGSEAALDAAAADRPQVKVIHFAFNRGQTIAIRAGLEAATGARWILMDGDRQNDPADMGMLLDRLDQGYVCVSGWRKNRQDTGLRRWPSRIANALLRRIARSPVHDLGCTLKAYRADALVPAELFGEMHRFLVLYAASRGKVTEMVVQHHPRTAGVSKYGLSRTARVLSDILLLRILMKYTTRPSHLFAKIAQYMVLAAALLLALGILSVWSALLGTILMRWILPAAILAVGAVNVLAIGVACELVMRNRYLISGDRPYRIARTVNLEPPASSPEPATADRRA
jgi:glycosyltransferase involved in cell wall biosynthesis